MKLDYVERTVLGENILDLPEPESYKSMRLTRRLGRGGRIWIDRFFINHNTSDNIHNNVNPIEELDNSVDNNSVAAQDGTDLEKNTNTTVDNVEVDKEVRVKKEPLEPENGKESVDDGFTINNNLDRALNLSNFDNFSIYSNETVLDTRPPFANPYEAGHVYNTLGTVSLHRSISYIIHIVTRLFTSNTNYILIVIFVTSS